MLRSPTAKPIKLDSVRPNLGIQAAFRKALQVLVAEMSASTTAMLKNAYAQNQPEIAQDASPAATLNDLMATHARTWQKKIDAQAEALGKHFATKMIERFDGALKAALAKGGFTVEFKMTRAANDVMQATISQQVGLIKSIGSEYFQEVQGLVMRSVSTGRDLKGLTDDLQARYGITRRRAAFIARDQNEKATASIQKARQIELGLQAVWRHSHGGEVPRPEHVEFDGKQYDPAKGMWSKVAGKFILPGEEINCRCFSTSYVMP